MKYAAHILALTTVVLAPVTSAWGHFQLLIPSAPAVYESANRTITLDLRFTHPMAGGPLMDMGRPERFGVMVAGKQSDLRQNLVAGKLDGKTVYSAEYTVRKPGDHVFYVQPAPYYEAAENTYIVHYTKVVVDAFGGGGGWDELLGFPVEIKPLVRPYGLWTGNAFRGVVLRDGKPVPDTVVEVEYLNSDQRVELPNPAFETQIIKTDAGGEFSYTMPRAGWWGFAALLEGPHDLKAPDGSDAGMEWGAVMWVPVEDME